MPIDYAALTPEQIQAREDSARQLKNLLQTYGITAAILARFANVPVNTVYSWLREKRPNPAPKIVWRFIELIAKVPEARKYAHENFTDSRGR